MNLKYVSDTTLLQMTKDLVKKEKQCTYRVLLHLKEVERRKLFCELNHQSIYDYCLKELNYTPAEASYRIQSMRLMKDSPKIEKAIQQGSLSLTNAVQVGNHLSKISNPTPEIKEELVSQVENKSKREAKIILQENENEKDKTKPPPPKKTPTPKIKVNSQIVNLLEEIIALDGGTEVVQLEKALQHRVERIKKRHTSNSKKIPTKQTKKTRHIPQAIKDHIRQRARGQCEYIALNGVRCQCRHRLEFDHIHMYCHGGQNTPANLRLICRAHNQRAAIKILGPEFRQNKMGLRGGGDFGGAFALE